MNEGEDYEPTAVESVDDDVIAPELLEKFQEEEQRFFDELVTALDGDGDELARLVEYDEDDPRAFEFAEDDSTPLEDAVNKDAASSPRRKGGRGPPPAQLPHATIYGAIDEEKLRAAQAKCEDMLAKRGVTVEIARAWTPEERERAFIESSEVLQDVIEAFGCEYTFVDRASDYSFSEYATHSWVLGHFMTAGQRIDPKELTKIETKMSRTTGKTYEGCISRVWEAWRRQLDDAREEVGWFGKNVHVYNSVPFSAHAHADGDAWAQKGMPLVTNEMLEYLDALAVIEPMIVRLITCIGAKNLVTMGAKTRNFVDRHRAAFAACTTGEIDSECAHVCWLQDRAFPKGDYKFSFVKQHHFANFGYALGILLDDEAKGMEAAKRFMTFVAEMHGKTGVDGSFVRYTREEMEVRRRIRARLARQFVSPHVPFGYTYAKLNHMRAAFKDRRGRHLPSPNPFGYTKQKLNNMRKAFKDRRGRHLPSPNPFGYTYAKLRDMCKAFKDRRGRHLPSPNPFGYTYAKLRDMRTAFKDRRGRHLPSPNPFGYTKQKLNNMRKAFKDRRGRHLPSPNPFGYTYAKLRDMCKAFKDRRGRHLPSPNPFGYTKQKLRTMRKAFKDRRGRHLPSPNPFGYTKQKLGDMRKAFTKRRLRHVK